jgi:2-methylcitrate dehydratase PrpD
MTNLRGNSPVDISDHLCRHIAECRFEQLPQGTRTIAKHAILDATGVMLAASGLSPEARPFIDIARSDNAAGAASILGLNYTTSAPMAAFANGALAHALDFEDAFDAAPCHPNAAAVPAAIAIAQACGPINGCEFITAIAVGCDLVCRMGLSLRQPMEQNGWYPPPILGAFGATATAARLLGLDAKQTRDALSITLCQATMPGEIMHSRGTVIRAVREAFPAKAAVVSAFLARDGVSGFETPLEGKAGFYQLYADGRFDHNDLYHGLGKKFYIEQLSFKPWPACRGTHAYIEIALRLLHEHGFDWQQVESVTVSTCPIHRMLLEPDERKRAPQNVIDAKFSIPFTVAVALVKGEVSLASFNPETLSNADVLSVARHIHAVERPDWGRDKAAAGALTLNLRDGRIFGEEVEYALGHPQSPLSTEQLVHKFEQCSAYAAHPRDPSSVRELADNILMLEEVDDCGVLFG